MAATRYKMGDYRPMLYKTNDYGQSWTQITNGIDAEHFTRVIRVDPERKGLLFAGTERGLYISFNDGGDWSPFQLNLPQVPITDLTIKDGNLIAATQGRSLWVIDDLGPLRQWQQEIAAQAMHLFKPLDTYRLGGGVPKKPSFTKGEDHPGGVLIHYYLGEEFADSAEVRIVLMQADGSPIKSFSSRDEKQKALFDVQTGLNRFVWDIRYPDPKKFEGMILWWSLSKGPKAVPGTYKVRLVVGTDSMEESFQLLADPRIEAKQEDLIAQFEFLQGVSAKLSETHQAITDIRQTRKELKQFTDKLEDEAAFASLKQMAQRIDSSMTRVEKALYQTQNRSRQDPLNFPIRLNNKLGHLGALVSVGDYAPTDQDRAFFAEVAGKIDAELAKWNYLQKNDIPLFNEAARKAQIEVLSVKNSIDGR